MRVFGELLREYMDRTGISDAELARTLGVRRQTIFRWKEGSVARPRHAEDVLRCAERLRLTAEERDELLISAGFPPQNPPVTSVRIGSVPSQVEPEGPPPSTSQQTARCGPQRRWLRFAAIALIALILAVLVWRLTDPSRPPVARQGEALLLVAPFTNYAGGNQGYNVAGRVQEALAREIVAGSLAGVRAAAWPTEIRDQASAQDALERSAAALAIWGEFDSGRVLAHLTRRVASPGESETRVEKLLASPADLSATINSALPEEVRAIALLSLGRMFADRGEYERARAALVQALTRPPDDPQAAASLYFLSGYVAQVGDPPDLDEAVEAYSRALKAQPDLAAAYNNRGLAYLRRGLAGDAALAVNDLTQAMAFLSPDASLLTNRGAAYLRLAGNPGEASGLRPQEATTLAVQDFDAAIALEPDMVEAIFDRGLAYVRLDEKENWLADFERVLELDADHAGAANGLCWAYALEQAPESALPYCERAVALDSTGAGLDSRAIVYGELGRYTEAAADMESYLQALRAQDETNYARLSPLREEWLTALRTGRNPFDRATLERLRVE